MVNELCEAAQRLTVNNGQDLMISLVVSSTLMTESRAIPSRRGTSLVFPRTFSCTSIAFGHSNTENQLEETCLDQEESNPIGTQVAAVLDVAELGLQVAHSSQLIVLL